MRGGFGPFQRWADIEARRMRDVPRARFSRPPAYRQGDIGRQVRAYRAGPDEGLARLPIFRQICEPL